MPMMHTPDSPQIMSYDKQPPVRTFFGHENRIASKCGHDIHPSDPEHTPWCSACTCSLARAKLDAANDKLVGEGGLHPPEYMRDRRWNRARKGYLIAKQHLDKVRALDQLRFEREQAWNDAHEGHVSRRSQAAVLPQNPSLCVVCDSMAASYPTNMPEVQVAEYAAWWEQPGAPVADHVLVPKTPPRSRDWKRNRAQITEGNPGLRKIVQSLRYSFEKQRVHRILWEARWATEDAIRKKHKLDRAYQFQDEFWEHPMSAMVSRRQQQYSAEEKSIGERRARGNTSRPMPPRSSLSYSETAEDVQLDPESVETLLQKEERVARGRGLERVTARVAEEVGYLYFVGEIDGMEEWKEDYILSDTTLVVRTQVATSETSDHGDEGSQDGDEGVQDEDEDAQDSDDGSQDSDEAEAEDEWDRMDLDD